MIFLSTSNVQHHFLDERQVSFSVVRSASQTGLQKINIVLINSFNNPRQQ